jgi:hypothetical protein
MTEQEWLECADDPQRMLLFVNNRISRRKARLFTVAAYYQRTELMRIDAIHAAVELCAAFADGQLTKVKFARHRRKARREYSLAEDYSDQQSYASIALNLLAPDHDPVWKDAANWADTRGERRGPQVSIIRCLICNPFRRSTVDPTWLTATVVSLAQAIYAELAFDRLPILADALEDAGCDNADILQHCRLPGEHVRGCWAVDLVLGKK